MPTPDREQSAQGGRTPRFNSGPQHLERWRIQTPLVLQRAIKACWDGTGTPAQKLLLSEWVTARVVRQPIPTSALRAALFAEQMEQRKETDEGQPESCCSSNPVRSGSGVVRRKSA